MLGVGGAGGFGFFFLLEPRLEAVPTRLRWDFFFLVFRDSELLVPEEKEAPGMSAGLCQENTGVPTTLAERHGHRARGAQLYHLPRPHP